MESRPNMKPPQEQIRLQLLPLRHYVGVDEKDPIKFYHLPIIGRMYQRRIELCLEQLMGGQSVLEVGFGSGVSFLNLSQLYQEIHGLDLTADARQVGEMFANLGVQTELRNGSVLEMPYPDQSFDTVLLISILEHLQPEEQLPAFREIWRVLKPGGQVVYGVPVERPFMVFMFRLLGTDIRQHHFSTETDVRMAAQEIFGPGKITSMRGPLGLFGKVYEVGEFVKLS